MSSLPWSSLLQNRLAELDDAVPASDACKILDRDMSELLRIIEAIKTKRNMLSPAASLPLPILKQIFSFLSTRELAHAAAVCRHWRTVGITGDQPCSQSGSVSLSSFLAAHFQKSHQPPMSLQIADHADRVQAQIGREIDDLKRFQQLFSIKYNAFAPVNVLPPEVLAHCFRFISLEQLIKVTSVCRYWRQVASEEPCLWASEIGTLPRFSEIQLSRSKEVPISISINTSSSSHGSELLRMALANIHRSWSCNLELAYSHAWKTLVVSQRAALLRSLAVISTSLIPLHLSIGDTPCLQHLRLFDVIPSWTTMSLATLVTLQVKTTYRGENSRSVSKKLLRALKRMPKLEQLDIQNSLGAIPKSFMNESISLPGLRSLQIVDCHATTKLMPILDLPPMERVRVQFGPLSGTDLLLNFTINTKPLRSLHVDFTCSAIRIKGWCREFTFPIHMSMTKEKPTIDVHFQWPSTAANQLMARERLILVLETLHVNKASCLYLVQDGKSMLTAVPWRSLSKRLSSLKKVYIGIKSSYSFVENALAGGAITTDSASEVNSSSVDAVAAPIFPSLRHVTLGARLNSFQISYEADSDDADKTNNKDSLGELLVRRLAERRERSSLSALISISHFGGIGNSDLRSRLEEFVPNVTRLKRAQWPEQ